jgi:two-component system response regulator AtoC
MKLRDITLVSPLGATLERSCLQVFLVGPDAGLGQVLGRALGEGFTLRCQSASTLEGLKEVLSWSDVFLVDLREAKLDPQDDSFEFLDAVGRIAIHPPVIVLCDEERRDVTLAAIDRGAADSIAHPPNIPELRLLLFRAHRFYQAEREIRELRAEQHRSGRLHNLLGTAPSMQELFNLAKRIAPADVNVLISGETGTGKELMARAIHHMGSRSRGPLVAFSCANLPDTLVEDELFGHEKGAFTGAFWPRQGRIETANHGSLFLDEVGDLPIGLQPKLLRVLQERSFERLGSNRSVEVDVRLISATNHDLADLVKQGHFREDLYYRLNVVELHLPALRERRQDIPLLAHHFLLKYAQLFKKNVKRLSDYVLSALDQYPWPGNVRELENIIQRAVVLSDGPTLELSHLPRNLRQGVGLPEPTTDSVAPADASSYEQELKRFKRDLVLRTLRQYGWRKAESARALGVARGYLHRLINQLDIREPDPSITESSAAAPAGQVM